MDRATRWRWALRAVLLATAALAWFMAPPARAQDEVPFITTPDAVTLAMLQLAGVGPQDTVLDLGSGDGRIVITAARRFGARGLGVEIVPDLVAQSQRHAQAAGVAARAEFRVQDLFATDLSAATVVTMYLLPAVNLQLRPRLLALKPGTRIVSHDWDLGDWLPDRSLTLDVPDKAIGQDKRSTVHLWVVPAPVQGLWCGAGATLQVTQRFQQFSATLTATATATATATGRAPDAAAAPVAVFDGRVGAAELVASGSRTGTSARLVLAGQALQLREATGAMSQYEGRAFTRAGAAGCPG